MPAWRARRRGVAGDCRPAHAVSPEALQRVHGLSVRAAAKALEVSPALVHKLRSQQEALPQDVEQLPTTP